MINAIFVGKGNQVKKIKRTPQVLIDENEYVPWAGVTRGQMIDEIYANEKKSGEDKNPTSFTNIMERIGKMWLKELIK